MTIENPMMIMVVPPRRALVKQLRREFKRQSSREFKRDLWQGFKRQSKGAFSGLPADEICIAQNLKDQIQLAFARAAFEVHHVIPLSLGGNNDPGNLVLVERVLHQKIHDKIKSYPKMKRGKPATIGIPIYPGKIWFLEQKPATEYHPQLQPRPLQQSVGLRGANPS